MRKAHFYLRVSSEQQLKGYGIERQKEICFNWLKKESDHNFEEGTIYCDEGKSAYSGANLTSSFGTLLKHIDEGVIRKGDVVIVEQLDRLSRRGFIEGRKETVNKILEAGVWLGVVKQGLLIDPSRQGNDLGTEFNIILALDLARRESQAKSQRIRATIDNKLLKGIKHTNNIPFYLNYDAESNEYVFNEHAQTLLTCVELREQYNYGSQRMINYLKEHNITSPITKPLLERYLFSRSCKTIFGTYTHTRKGDDGKVVRTEYPNYYPPLITQERWLNLLSSRTPANSYGKNQQRNLFSQLILCPVCFSPLSYFKAVRGLPKLRCKRAVSGAKDCSNTNPIHNYLPIETTLVKVFKHLNFLPQNKGDREILSNRLRTEEQRLHKLKESLNTIDPDLIDMVVSKLTECKNKITSLKLDLSNINVKALDNIPADLSKVEHRTQFNSTLKQYVNSIVIYQEKYLISLKNNRLIVLYLDSEISPEGLNRILLGDGGIEFNLNKDNLDEALTVYEKYHKQKAREYLRKGNIDSERFKQALERVYLD